MRRRNRAPFNLSAVSDANSQGLATLPPELYIPLWWYSGSSLSTTSTSSGSIFPVKGGSSSSGTVASAQLVTPSADLAKFNFALEAYGISNSGGAVIHVALWDITANCIVSQSQISINGAGTVIGRSGQFTLFPNHQYGVTFWSNNSSYTVQVTDVSLVVFPGQQLAALCDLSKTTLGITGPKLKESYIPLWMYSASNVAGNSPQTAAGKEWLQKASTTPLSNSGSSGYLHTLNSKWLPSQQFALEISMNASNSLNTVYAAVWDFTTSSIVSASQVSSSTSTFNLIRSASFTLIPGHNYGVTYWCTNSSYSTYITKAHLVALLAS